VLIDHEIGIFNRAALQLAMLSAVERQQVIVEKRKALRRGLSSNREKLGSIESSFMLRAALSGRAVAGKRNEFARVHDAERIKRMLDRS
jgi:hypothetical protein